MTRSNLLALRRSIIATAPLVLAITLAACSNSSPDSAVVAPPVAVAPVPAPAPAPSPTPSPTCSGWTRA